MLYLVLLSKWVDWLEQHMLTCPSKKYLGLECMGCGLQRSFIALIKGNLIESLSLYPATIPLLFLILYTFLHFIFKFKNGAKTIQWVFICTASIIVTSYCIKLIGK